MIQQIGTLGVIVTAAGCWVVGIIFGLQQIGRGVKSQFTAGNGWSRDWSGATFAIFMLLVWLGLGFLVMAQVTTH